jgi:hypothetical protein
MMRERHAVLTGEMKDMYEYLFGKPEEEKMRLEETESEEVE